MAKKHQLRQTRLGAIINTTSVGQEKEIYQALVQVAEAVGKEHQLHLHHDSAWPLKYIVDYLRRHFPDEDFHYHFDTSSIRPDGGILSLLDTEGNKYPVLISEVKTRGPTISVSRKVCKSKQRATLLSALERM